MDLSDVLKEMGDVYRADPVKAVRSQGFIKLMHTYLEDDLNSRLTKWAKTSRKIYIKKEAGIIGSSKEKDVDVAVIDPVNGPLLLVGVRSQMSSVGKNTAGYYEGLLGEVTSLQERFPISTHGYVYLHPKQPIKAGKEAEVIDHARWARMYASMSGRGNPVHDRDYKNLRSVYDHFAYMVVDFNSKPASVDDALVRAAVPDMDMSISTFVDRMVATFKARLVFLNVFN